MPGRFKVGSSPRLCHELDAVVMQSLQFWVVIQPRGYTTEAAPTERM